MTADAVLTALGAVRDPELDEPVTALGFVASCTVSEDGAADVHLRLPTYFCAPNFAFLMVADAYEAVSAVPGVRTTTVVLDDHFASAEINAGVAARAGFVASFGALADAELDALRRDFLRKAVLAGTDRVCRPLLAAGRTPDELAALALGDAPPSADRERLRARRAELGLPSDDTSALLVDAVTGENVGVQALPLHLRRARLTRTGVEANTGICRGMLRDRYATAGVGAVDDADERALPTGPPVGPQTAVAGGTHLAVVRARAGDAGAGVVLDRPAEQRSGREALATPRAGGSR